MTASSPARSLRGRVRSVLLLIVALVAAVVVPVSGGASAETAKPYVGLLEPTTLQTVQLIGGPAKRVMVHSAWDVLEPLPGVYNVAAATAFKTRITTLRLLGFQVTLELGLQNAPAWVFSLPGQTRFVNQDGRQWSAGEGENVPNAVYNDAVRQAQASYISALGAFLGPDNFVSVRIGGLLSGELRYPLSGPDDLWFYDPAAQAKAPYPGWRPGTGTPAQARASLQYYFDSLTGYESWLMGTVAAAFPGVSQQVMLPSWGVRPGQVDAAVTAGLHGTTAAEANGAISMGLDWSSQVRAIRAAGVNGVVYSTWLDAPSQGSSVQQISPIEYLAQLAAANGLPAAGENAGGGGVAALQLCLTRIRTLGLQGMMYFAGPAIENGQAGITFAQFQAAAASF